MTAGELLVKLGFEVDTLKLNEFIKDLGELNMSSVIAATGFKGMVDGLTEIMRTADAVGSSFNKLTAITGVQAQTFEAWENVARQVNVTTGLTSQSISDLQKNIQLAKIGQGNLVQAASVFGPRGVQFLGRENDPAGVLRDILRSMEGLDPAMRRLMLHAAGMNEELSLLVGHEDEYRKQLTNTQPVLDNIVKYHKAIGQLASDWKIAITQIGGHLAPILTALTEILDTVVSIFMFLDTHTPEWVKDLIGAVAVLGIMAATLTTIVGLATRLAGVLAGLGGAKLLGLLAGLTPQGKVALGLGIGGGLLYELLKPKDHSGGNIDQSGDINQTNTYNIHGNDPNSITQRIQELHEAQMRDAQSQSSLVSY